MNPYRIKHTPTGLYYKPNSGLTKGGKVYTTQSNVLTYFSGDTVSITLDVQKKQFKKFLEYFTPLLYMGSHRSCTYSIPKTDFEIEYITEDPTEKSLTFTLSGKEYEKAQKWIKKQKKKHGTKIGTIGDRFSYRFTPTGIGIGVTVIDALSGEEENVTDYSTW